MSNYFQSYSSSYASRKGEVTKNTEEQYQIENQKGTYLKKEFGNIVDSRELEREEIDKFFNEHGYYIGTSTLRFAEEIIKNKPKKVRKLNF